MFSLLLCAAPELTLKTQFLSASSAANQRLDFALSLARLTHFAIEDRIRDAAIFAPAILELDRIADHAGCAIYDSDSVGWEQALQNARCSMIFILQAGFAPETEFLSEAREPGGGAFALYKRPAQAWRRIFHISGLPVGLTARKDDLLTAAQDHPLKLPLSMKRKVKIRPYRSYAKNLRG